MFFWNERRIYLPAACGWVRADLRRGSWLDSRRRGVPGFSQVLAAPATVQTCRLQRRHLKKKDFKRKKV
jgi:hypothetical protein